MVEIGFSQGQAEFESHLLDRGVSHRLFKILGCQCGQAETLADVVGVQKGKHDDFPTFYCRGCLLTLDFDGPTDWDPDWPPRTKRGWMNPDETTGVFWWTKTKIQNLLP